MGNVQICNQPLTCKKTTKKLQKHLLFTEAMSDIPEGLTVHYWGGVKSRGQSNHVVQRTPPPSKKKTNSLLTRIIQWILNYFGQGGKYNIKNDQNYPGTPEFNALPHRSFLGQLPYLTDKETGACLGQTVAIINYCARKFGFEPSDMKDYATSQEMLIVSSNFRNFIGCTVRR